MNSKRPVGEPMVFASSGSLISTGSSITSKKRWIAVLASSVMESRKPMDSVGQRKTVAVAKNATRPPTVKLPSATRKTPTSMDAATAVSGINNR